MEIFGAAATSINCVRSVAKPSGKYLQLRLPRARVHDTTQPAWTFACSPDRRRHDRHGIGVSRPSSIIYPTDIRRALVAADEACRLRSSLQTASRRASRVSRRRGGDRVREYEILSGSGPSKIRFVLHGSYCGGHGNPSCEKTQTKLVRTMALLSCYDWRIAEAPA
jgi:hypothetical protein